MRLALLTSFLIVSAFASACDGGVPTPAEAFEKSCSGEAVLTCRPYQYAIVREATVTPNNVEVGDPLARLMIHVAYDSCDASPGRHVIGIRALTGSSVVDGGTGGSVLYLDEIHDDGMNGDAAADDGLVDVEVPSFFDVFGIPTDADLTLRFEPNLEDCTGGAFELPYHTGPMWTP